MHHKSRIIKTAAVVFCTGVLLGGIGTGLAIAEYTSLEYTGEHILGAEHRKTKNIDVDVVPKEGKKIRILDEYRGSGIQYKEDVPMDTIRYVVTYNSELVEQLWADYHSFEPEEEGDIDGAYMEDREQREEEQEYVTLRYSYIGNEFDLLMRNKDKILNGLKHGQIGFYRTEEIESIEIWVNPGMKPFIEQW